MNESHSDAFVFFGATGDLAFKKIFPSLYAMSRRGHLNVPVIGIGRSAPDLAALKARARESLDISALPEDALAEINRIQTRQRFNEVVKTGSPGFIPQGR